MQPLFTELQLPPNRPQEISLNPLQFASIIFFLLVGQRGINSGW